MNSRAQVGRHSLLLAASVLGGALLALAYGSVVVIAPRVVPVALNPEDEAIWAYVTLTLVVSTVFGVLAGAASALVSIVLVSAVRPRSATIRAALLAAGPLSMNAPAYFLFFTGPAVAEMVVFAVVTVIGAAGIILIDRRIRPSTVQPVSSDQAE